MISKQKSYLITCLLVSSIMLYAVNLYVDVSLSKAMGYNRILASLFFVFALVTLITYYLKKTLMFFKISLITLSVFFILNAILVTRVVANEIYKYEMSQIDKINSYEKAKSQFKSDLEEEDLKYFTFGIVSNKELKKKLEEEYNLSVYHMGCIVNPSLECYNELVQKYIEDKSNKEFFDL